VIVGAGLAGLIAAHAWPTEPVFEASPEPTSVHKALLRFRSTAVADLVGIEFTPVTVRKGIWFEGQLRQPDIRLANLYAEKVVGRLADRSIWNLDPVTRWIAPEDLYERLIGAISQRLSWGVQVDFASLSKNTKLINTAPLPVVLNSLKRFAPTVEGLEFDRAPIKVSRWRVPNASVYQTIYFPSPETSVYRASITGDLLIVEEAANDLPPCELEAVCEAFALQDIEALDPLEAVEQKYGKIVPLPDAPRKALLAVLTQEHEIYSLGRYATWRNILLDDVVQDISVIKRLMNTDRYSLRMAAIKQS